MSKLNKDLKYQLHKSPSVTPNVRAPKISGVQGHDLVGPCFNQALNLKRPPRVNFNSLYNCRMHRICRHLKLYIRSVICMVITSTFSMLDEC